MLFLQINSFFLLMCQVSSFKNKTQKNQSHTCDTYIFIKAENILFSLVSANFDLTGLSITKCYKSIFRFERTDRKRVTETICQQNLKKKEISFFSKISFFHLLIFINWRSSVFSLTLCLIFGQMLIFWSNGIFCKQIFWDLKSNSNNT